MQVVKLHEVLPAQNASAITGQVTRTRSRRVALRYVITQYVHKTVMRSLSFYSRYCIP